MNVNDKALMLVNENEFNLMWRQAEIIAKSGLVPKSISTPEKVIVVMLTGRELGLPTMASIRSIDVINQQPAVKPQAMIGLIERSGFLESIHIDDDGQKCTVTMKRVGRDPHTESFSMKDAQRMKTTEWEGGNKKSIPLADKYNWQQMPEVMRKWRAIAACARVVFPDVILGLYTTEEIGDERPVTDDGDVIDGSFDVTTGEIIQDRPQGHQDGQGATEAPQQVETPPPPASAPLGADRDKSTHNPPVESMAAEIPEVVDDPPSPVWPNDDARWIKLVETARTQLWNNLVIRHAQNRVAKALGLPSWDARHTYTGSDKDAWNACKAYVPSDKLPPKDKEGSFACVDCGKDTFNSTIEGEPLCNDCAKLRAEKQFAN